MDWRDGVKAAVNAVEGAAIAGQIATSAGVMPNQYDDIQNVQDVAIVRETDLGQQGLDVIGMRAEEEMEQVAEQLSGPPPDVDPGMVGGMF